MPKPALSWPHNKRHQLPDGHGRHLFSTARWLGCYRNGGLYKIGTDPGDVPPFSPNSNRASRRANGQRGDLYGEYYQPRTSPRAAPYDGVKPRSTVEARRVARAKERVARVMQWMRDHLGEDAEFTAWQAEIAARLALGERVL